MTDNEAFGVRLLLKFCERPGMYARRPTHPLHRLEAFIAGIEFGNEYCHDPECKIKDMVTGMHKLLASLLKELGFEDYEQRFIWIDLLIEEQEATEEQILWMIHEHSKGVLANGEF